MSSAEAQQQSNWPELDVRYFRWDPPVFPGPATSSAPPTSASPTEQPKKGSRPRIESAFAHSTYPSKLAGWDPAARRDASADQPSTSAHGTTHGEAGEQGALPSGQETLDFQGMPIPLGQPAAPQEGGGQDGQPAWATSQGSYGSSFDNLFALAEPAGLRYGVPQGQSMPGVPAHSGASVGQSSAPFLTVQCGRFSAPVQREAVQPHAAAPGHATTQPMCSQLQHDFQAWSRQQERRGSGGSSSAAQAALAKLERMPAPRDPLQLQEYYAAQSDLLEGIMRTHRQNATNLHAPGMDHGLMDLFGGPLNLGRANSTLEVPSAHSLMGPHRGGWGSELEPYMPQWQSESVPAELPNHVVDRLLMSGNHEAAQKASKHSRRNSLSGSKRSWGGLPSMPSIPDDRELPRNGKGGSPPDSPDVDHLEELARTADLEVAHRAFLVPPHKKRGKGGRQPAADPRLDPNIDERKAKRILANRLSAARSKMKQKNQMDVLAGIIDQLDHHNKELHEDVSELMEVCEGIEFTNRALLRDCHILEEYLRRCGEAQARAHT